MKHQNGRRRESRLEALRSHPEFRGPVELPGDHDATEHLALIYDSPEQQFDAVIPFIKQGLERDERCLYITYENSRDEVLEALRTTDIDVDAALDSGQLSIHDEEETYLRTGAFDPDDTLEFLDTVIETATEEYEALRMTGEMSSVLREDPKGEDLIEYEAKSNSLFDNVDGIALCQYNRERFPEDIIQDVIKTHPYIVYDDTISRNVYYIPPDEFLDGERTQERDVDRLLEALLNTTEVKRTLQEHVSFLRELNTVTASQDRSFEEKLQTLFDLGCERFDLDLGVLARVDPHTGRFEIEHMSDDHGYFQPGAELPLSESYCTTAIDSGNVVDVPLVENGCEGITVIEEFGLQSPLGTYVEVDGDPDRVFFFVATHPQDNPFSSDKLGFHALLGQWLKDELEQNQQAATSEQTTQLTNLVQELIRTVVEERTRSKIEKSVCDRLTTVDHYEAAWIGDRPVTDQQLTPRVWAGIQEDTVQSVTDADPESESSLELPLRAVNSRQPVVTQLGGDEPVVDPCYRQLREQGVKSALAVPIEYNDTCFGVLVVYASRSDALNDHHQAMLAKIGNLIGFAIAAMERKEALVTDEVIELEVRVRDPDHFFFAVTAEIDVMFTLGGIIAQSDGSYLVYVTATGTPVEAVLEHTDQSPDIDHARLVDDDDDDALMEFVFAGPTVVETFAEYGGTVTAATAEDGEGTVIVEVPRTADTRAVVDAFQTTFPDSEVVAKRTRERPVTTARGFRQALSSRLTEKQREVLQAAYFAGYFDHPRRSTGGELADTLDISSSTFHQHLQVGLHKLLTAAFDDQNDR